MPESLIFVKSPAASTNPGRATSGLRLLTLAGGLSLLAYIALFLLLHSRSLWESPTLVPDRWKPLFHPIKQMFPSEWLLARRTSPIGLLNSILYLVVLSFAFAVFLYAVRRAFRAGAFTQASSRAALKIILLFTFLILAVCFIVPGSFSTDLYSYIWYGRINAVFGDNPFLSVPMDYAWYDKGKWLQWVYWKDVPSAYGPVWIWVASGIALVAQALDGNIVTHLLGHKLVYSLTHVANIVMLWKVARIVVARYWPTPNLPDGVSEEQWRAGIQTAITLTYAWTPLAFIEFGVGGHNDVLLATCVLIATRLHLSGRWRLAVATLAVSGLIKVTGLFFLPAYLFFLFWDARARDGSPASFLPKALRVGQGVAIVALVWAVGYAPFWETPTVLRALTGGPPAIYSIHSLGNVLVYKGAQGIGHLATALGWEPAGFWSPFEISSRLGAPVRWGFLFIWVVASGFYVLRARTFPNVVISWGWIMFAYLTVGAVWFWPWYITWLLIPVVLIGPSRLFTATQILSFSALAIYAVHPRAAPPLSELPGWTGLIIMAPPLLYLLGSWIRDAVLHRAVSQHTAEIPPHTVAAPSRMEPLPVPGHAGHANLGFAGTVESNEA